MKIIKRKFKLKSSNPYERKKNSKNVNKKHQDIIYERIRNYCSGKTKFDTFEELDFLSDPELQNFTGVNLSTNSGKISEWYVSKVLEQRGVDFIKQPIIKYGKGRRYLQPDFYIPSKNLFIEVKSRTYNCGGTCSEKIDHVARKYSTKLKMTKEYKNSKVLIVFCAGELFEESTLQLIRYRLPCTPKYIRGFVEFTKKHNVLDWIGINNIEKYI